MVSGHKDFIDISLLMPAVQETKSHKIVGQPQEAALSLSLSVDYGLWLGFDLTPCALDLAHVTSYKKIIKIIRLS